MGWHKIKDDDVIRVTASDPNGDAITYTLGVGNDNGLFKINSETGEIKLAKNLDKNWTSIPDLEVRANDGQADNIKKTVVSFNLKTTVGVGGDTRAVEKTVDTMTVKFVRFSNNVSNDLKVKYRYTLGAGLRANDFLDNADFKSFRKREIIIPANKLSVSLTLTAKDDDFEEFIESMEVTVRNGTNYIPVDSNPLDPESQDLAYRVYRAREFYITDSVVLFGKENKNVSLRDTGIAQENPGIHVNDISQAGLGDCHLMAAFAALADEDWQHVSALFTKQDNENGKYTVRLCNFLLQPPNRWADYELTSSLSRGWSSAQLTGDYDSDKRTEIWPILLERGFSKHWRKMYPNRDTRGWRPTGQPPADAWAEIDKGGLTCDAWKVLTGKTDSNWKLVPTNATNQVIWNYIKSKKDHPEKRIVIGT